MAETAKERYRQKIVGMGKRHGRRWKPEDLEYLRTNYGKVSDVWLARRLGRRASSIRWMAGDIGLRRTENFLTLNEVARMFGCSYTMALRWVRQDYLVARKSKFVRCGTRGGPVGLWQIEPGAVEEFVRRCPDQYDIRRIDREGYPHLYELARAAGATRRRGEWSELEDALLLRLAPRHTLDELAERLGRTRAGVACRLTKLRARRHLIPRDPGYVPGKRWAARDLAALREMWGTLPVELIAEQLERNLPGVKGKAKRLGLPSGKAWLAGTARREEQEAA